MYEYGNPWTLTGPDGTTITSGTSGLVVEDISGFDMPTVRTNVEDIPEDDGAVFGDQFYGRRPVTISGRIVNVTPAERNNIVQTLQRVCRALRGDMTLRTTPSGMPEQMVYARLDQPLRISKAEGIAKSFLISLVCADPRIYSYALHEYAGTYSTTLPGAAFDWVFPVNFGGGTVSGLATIATNLGNAGTRPIIRVTGPIDNPQILNVTTGESMWVDDLSLLAGQWIEIDFARKSALDQNGYNRYSHIRFPQSTWFDLEPGANSIQVFGTNAAPGAQLDIDWRDAWI